tara:strand:+ start:14027 stop:14272 length:246 start_codon:yes stop_codon:yes gene_type:complete
MRENIKRYTVVIDTYVYAQGDEEARKIAHSIKRNITEGDHTKVIEISETPFASLQSRELKDLSEPKINGDTVWTEKDELPF